MRKHDRAVLPGLYYNTNGWIMLPPCVYGIEYIYNVTTALFCHRLLEMYFREESVVLWDPVLNSSHYRFVSNSANRAFPTGYSLVPEIDNATNVAMVCTGLTADDCQRWVSCSRAARDCCERQKAANTSGSDTEFQCSIIWDGISCFDAIPNGTILDLPCPSYYIPSGESGKLFSSYPDLTRSVSVSVYCYM